MPARNQKTLDIKRVNANFDQIDNAFVEISKRCRPMMPLVADSVDFTRKLLALYKEAFNKGLEIAKK